MGNLNQITWKTWLVEIRKLPSVRFGRDNLHKNCLEFARNYRLYARMQLELATEFFKFFLQGNELKSITKLLTYHKDYKTSFRLFFPLSSYFSVAVLFWLSYFLFDINWERTATNENGIIEFLFILTWVG